MCNEVTQTIKNTEYNVQYNVFNLYLASNFIIELSIFFHS